MKQYIYDYIDGMTDNYHSGGGLVIITAGDPQETLNRDYERDWAEFDSKFPAPTLPEKADHVYELAGTPAECVLIFPDTGCC